MTFNPPITQEQIEGALAVEETFDRATTTDQERRFRKVLNQARQGLITDREAFAEVCDVLGVPIVLNTPWWVYIERDGEPDLAIGPYPDEASAILARDESGLIGMYCEENCTECFSSQDQPKPEDEQCIVDLDNPDHTGAPDPDDA